MVKCSAYRCENASHNKTSIGLSFHRFPTNVNTKKAWIENVKRQDWQPNSSSVLCSKHFKDHLLDSSSFCTRLRPGAIPTLFNELPLAAQNLPKTCVLAKHGDWSAGTEECDLMENSPSASSDETDDAKEEEELKTDFVRVEVSGADPCLDRPDVCRCCLTTSGSWDLTGSYMSDEGETEVLLDMLRESLGIRLPLSEFGPSRFICDTCATSLRHAHNFKRQVLRAEERFAAYLRERKETPQRRPPVPGGSVIPGTGSSHGNGGAGGAKNPARIQQSSKTEIKTEDLEEAAVVDIFETDELCEDIEIKIENEDKDLTIETSDIDYLESIERSPKTEHLSEDYFETEERFHSTHLSMDESRTIQDTGHSSTDKFRTIHETCHSSTDKSRTIHETGHSSTDKSRTIQDTGHSSTDKSRTTQDTGHSSTDKSRTTQDTGHSSTDKSRTIQDTGHSSTDKSKATHECFQVINTDHTYTKKPEDPESDPEDNTEYEPVTCLKSTRPTLLIKPLVLKNCTKESDPVETNLEARSLLIRNQPTCDENTSSGSKKIRKMSSADEQKRKSSLGENSKKVGKKSFSNKKMATPNNDFDSDTPISQLCKEYTHCTDITGNLKKGRSDTGNLNVSPKAVCKGRQYAAAHVKQVSYRKRIRVSCDTVLKHTTACPFRHHKSWFQCFYCTLPFMAMDMLRHHTTHNHTSKELTQIKRYPRSLQIDISEFQCKICSVDLTDVENMINHFSEVHQKVVYKECIADYKVNTSPYACHLCSEQYHVFRTLTTHLNEHYANCICDVCGKSFLNSKRLKVHIRTHESGSFPCSECGKILKTKSSKANHMESAHCKRVIKCHMCLKPMKHYNDRIKHMSEVHNVTHTFKCLICGREFNIKHYLATHMRQTHGHKNKKCSECGMAFITNHGLKKHMLKHTGAKDFPCSLCTKSFARSYTLKEHMRGHGGEAKFVGQRDI